MAYSFQSAQEEYKILLSFSKAHNVHPKELLSNFKDLDQFLKNNHIAIVNDILVHLEAFSEEGLNEDLGLESF